MPSYKYFCKECNDVFEYECKMSEYKATQKCEKCGSECERAVNDLVSGSCQIKTTGFCGGASSW